MSGGGGCEAQSGQQWAGGRCEGWTLSCSNFEQAVRPRYIQGIVDSSFDGGEKEAALELLGVLPVITGGGRLRGHRAPISCRQLSLSRQHGQTCDQLQVIVLTGAFNISNRLLAQTVGLRPGQAV